MQAKIDELEARLYELESAPKKAKSFTMTEFRHTDYHGNFVDKATGYATITVEYFTTKTEGKALVER